MSRYVYFVCCVNFSHLSSQIFLIKGVHGYGAGGEIDDEGNLFINFIATNKEETLEKLLNIKNMIDFLGEPRITFKNSQT